LKDSSIKKPLGLQEAFDVWCMVEFYSIAKQYPLRGGKQHNIQATEMLLNIDKYILLNKIFYKNKRSPNCD
jgi:hypothetical protein